jgi:hypothetical protein
MSAQEVATHFLSLNFALCDEILTIMMGGVIMLIIYNSVNTAPPGNLKALQHVQSRFNARLRCSLSENLNRVFASFRYNLQQ